MAMRVCQSCIGCQQRCIKRLGQRHICTVIGRHGIAQLPYSGNQCLMTVPFNVQLRKVSEPLFRSCSRNVFTLHHAPQCVRYFDIQ